MNTNRIASFMYGIAIVTFLMAFSTTSEARENLFTLKAGLGAESVVYLIDL